MIKQTISPEKFSILQRYKELTKELKVLKEQRSDIIKNVFDKTEESVVTFTVRGKGIGFLIEKQEANSVSWKGIAEQEVQEEIINTILPDFSKPYNKYLVKI